MSVRPVSMAHHICCPSCNLLSARNDIGTRNQMILTPNMNQMIKEGIMLQRHYVFKFCSPSRSSAISARLPIHVNQENSATVQPWSGIMANFTTFPERLKEAGYATAQVGK